MNENFSFTFFEAAIFVKSIHAVDISTKKSTNLILTAGI